MEKRLKSLSDVKIIDLSKFKAFADDNFNVDQMAQIFFDRVEYIVGKGEKFKSGYQHFLLYQNVLKGLFPRGSKLSFVW